jgi:predicted RNA-binding Zn-ribbon protein involved in translation (DUF1610 family)
MYESGALAKHLDKARVVPYLFDMRPREVQPPLSWFQAQEADKEGTRRLLLSINSQLAEQELDLDAGRLTASFEKWWTALEDALSKIPPPTSTPPPQRTNDDVLEEILYLVRNFARAGLPQSQFISTGLPSESRTGLSGPDIITNLAYSPHNRRSASDIVAAVRDALNFRCPNCGAVIIDELHRYCHACGQSL